MTPTEQTTASEQLKKLRSLKTFEKDDVHFSGEYKGWSIEITKEDRADSWYIVVESDRGTAYDCYFDEWTNNIDAVILQALKGSCLYGN